MTENVSDMDPEPDGPDTARDAPFAEQWADGIYLTSYAPLSRDETIEFLADLADDLRNALLNGELSTRAVEDAGRALIGRNFTSSATLSRSLTLIGRELPRILELPDSPENRARIAAVQGALAAGFTEALRKHVFDRQEALKAAMVNAREQAEEALRDSEQRFRTVFNSAASGVATINLNGRFKSTNPAMLQLLRMSEDELLASDLFDLVHAEDVDKIRSNMLEQAVGRIDDRFRLVVRFLLNQDEPIWTRVAVSLVRDHDGSPDYHVVLVEDLSDVYLLQEHLRYQVSHDQLTGLRNRSVLLSTLERVLAELRPAGRVALCQFGIDGFGLLNEGLGHEAGDEVLRTVARRLRDHFREHGGMVARLDGDEFAVLIANSPGAAETAAVVERALGVVSEPITVLGEEIAVSASAGLVERVVGDLQPLQLLGAAGQTLRRAKRDGRAQWTLYDQSLAARDRQRAALAATMPTALRRYEFYLDYEPVVRLADASLAAVRAVARWDHPEHGMLGARDFVDVATECGQIIPIGRWMLRQACEQLRRWRDRCGLRAVISVPLSDRHTADPDLVADVRDALETNGLTPSDLQVECWERAILDEDGDLRDSLVALTELGVHLVLRRMSGYTCFSQLESMPVEALVVSAWGTRTTDHGEDSVDNEVLRTVLPMLRKLDVTLIADAVRSEEEVRRLHDLGCDLAYGPLFGAPGPPEDIEDLAVRGVPVAPVP
ncbi:putative bifunctional diguanylate cyclase/phosphodiesterase [Actinoalloteichus caeruleus]|uniref:putative bifunctional diguanylate cyclase/phosphodiesterase n=1 Tax=Actinoalloteichus cyanogriseus TaxID=2893586 RepID=UPI003AAC57A7